MGTVMATENPSPFSRRSDDMTLDDFLRIRVRQVIAEELNSREDVLA